MTDTAQGKKRRKRKLIELNPKGIMKAMIAYHALQYTEDTGYKMANALRAYFRTVKGSKP